MRRVRRPIVTIVGLCLGVGILLASSVGESARAKTTTSTVLPAVERLRQQGVSVTASEQACIATHMRTKDAAIAASPVELVLACLPQRVLIDQIVGSFLTTPNPSVHACLVRALEGTPWVALADLYRAFDRDVAGRHGGSGPFTGRFDPYRRDCIGASVAGGAGVGPAIVLDDLTDRWNAAVTQRAGSDLRLVANWVSTGPDAVSAGLVSPTIHLAAFLDSAASTPPTGADAAVANAPSTPPRVSAIFLSVRPVPDVKGAVKAVGLLAETIDASGRAAAAVRGLRLAAVLGPGSPTVKVRVSGILYTASVFHAPNQPDALQLTAFTDIFGG